MAEEHSLGSICAVVVTYNIGNNFDTCFNSLRGQVDHAIIVNTSTDEGVTARALERLRAAYPDFVDIRECPENNLGMAQNMGIALALEQNYDWVLLVDHDSRLGAGMISAMEQAYFAADNRLNIGIIAPNIVDTNAPNSPQHYVLPWFGYWFERKSFDADTPVIDHVLYVIASGSLIPARVLRQEEFHMDETLIIDHIDTDFSLRLVTEGLRIIAVRDAKLLHKIGERKTHHFLGMKVVTSNHPPIRRYYHFRNRLKMWRRYAAERPSYFVFDLARTVYELWRIILFESDKQDKLLAASQGVWDGVRGVRGPRPGTDITRPEAMRKGKTAA